jgi:hypothetical protein
MWTEPLKCSPGCEGWSRVAKDLRMAKNRQPAGIQMRLKAHLGGFAIQVGERFIIELGRRCFYGRVPFGRGGREWFIDFTGHLSPGRAKIEDDSRYIKWKRLG